MAKIECGSQSVVVARWVRPAIEHAQDVPLVGEARSVGLFLWSLCAESLFVVNLLFRFYYYFFSFLVLAVSFSQK